MGPKVTPEAFTNIAPILSRINPRIIPMVSDALQSDTGQALQARVIAISNAMGLPLPTTSFVMGQSGVSSNVPTGAAAYSAYGVAPPTNGQGAAPGMGGVSSAPGLPQNLPTGTPEYFASSADAGTKMLTNGPTLANNKAMLLTLDGLSNEAATGPTSGFEQCAGELAQRFGIALPFDAAAKTGKGMGQTSATEEYGKIAATLRQQMATTGFGFAGGHATDAFLNNSEEAMPNLNLSKLGRTGITHWLLGTNDAMQTMQKAWAQSGLAPQQFLGWMNGRVPVANGTFDINSFDPRVLQYARMTPQERTVFRSQMQPTAQAEFGAHLTDYTNRGWVTGPSTTNKVSGTEPWTRRP